MKPRHLVLAGFLSPLALAACMAEPTAAEIETKVRVATASVITGASTEQIAISHFERGAVKATWQATANGKSYACDSDEQLRLPACRVV